MVNSPKQRSRRARERGACLAWKKRDEKPSRSDLSRGKFLAEVWASLRINCPLASGESFGAGARECPSVDLFRRQRDGHLNYSTESLTAVAGRATRNLCEREHILH